MWQATPLLSNIEYERGTAGYEQEVSVGADDQMFALCSPSTHLPTHPYSTALTAMHTVLGCKPKFKPSHLSAKVRFLSMLQNLNAIICLYIWHLLRWWYFMWYWTVYALAQTYKWPLIHRRQGGGLVPQCECIYGLTRGLIRYFQNWNEFHISHYWLQCQLKTSHELWWIGRDILVHLIIILFFISCVMTIVKILYKIWCRHWKRMLVKNMTDWYIYICVATNLCHSCFYCIV